MAYKSQGVLTTVGAAIADAFSEYESLAGEMRETADNMENANMGHMSKCEAASAAADELENHTEIDVPEFLQDLVVKTMESVNKNKRRGPSRAIRLSNAQSLMQAARDAVQTWIDETKKDDPDGKEAEGLCDEADQFANDLDEHCEFDVEFPGMFG